MADYDAPPQLGEIPQRSELRVPTLQSNMNDNPANSSLQSTKDAIYDSEVSKTQIHTAESNTKANTVTCFQFLLLA